jgi:hypothetical protein
MFNKTLGAMLAAGAFVALGSSVAAAAPDATGCMPPVVGVPWSGTAPTVDALDDLKWNGSFAYEWAMGGPHDGEFRQLLSDDGAGNKTLYVYYKSLVHRPTIYWGDGMQFGISYDTTDSVTHNKKTIGQIVNFTFGATAGDGPNLDGTWTSPTVDGAGKPMSIPPAGVKLVQQTTDYDSTGMIPTLHPTVELTTPAWVAAHAYFWILSDPNTPTNLYYVAQVAIPIKNVTTATTAGLYVDPTQFATPSLGIPFWGDELSYEVATAIQIPRPWPNKDYGSQGRLDGDKYQPPSPDHWGKLQPADTTVCTGGGLAFQPSDITNNGGYSIDLWENVGGTPMPGNNTMEVQVTNRGPAVTPGDIKATFNIAPFGSQTAHSVSWQPINIANNAIQCASGHTGDLATCNPKAVTSTPIGSTAFGSSASFTLQADRAWNPDWSFVCAVDGDDGVLYSQIPALKTKCMSAGQWLPSASDAAANNAIFEHECMMVQLNSTANVQFDTQSQFMNMHVAAHASHFEQTARIDSSGVAPLKGQTGHWMYLVVETRNMVQDIPNGIDSPYSQKILDRLLNGSCDGEFCQRSPNAIDYTAKYFPTMLVHVYHPTGLHKKIKGKSIEVYEPQSSYGYYVSHDGKLYGWDAGLKGKGLKRVSDNTYRIWVPNDKAVDVTTTVDALDKPRCGH